MTLEELKIKHRPYIEKYSSLREVDGKKVWYLDFDPRGYQSNKEIYEEFVDEVATTWDFIFRLIGPKTPWYVPRMKRN